MESKLDSKLKLESSLDSKNMDCHDFAKAESRNDDKLDSKTKRDFLS